MSTKVKGEAIKEGSIPLSALAKEVKDKIENAGGGADWNAQEGEAGYIENKPLNTMLRSTKPLNEMGLDNYNVVRDYDNETYHISFSVVSYFNKIYSEEYTLEQPFMFKIHNKLYVIYPGEDKSYDYLNIRFNDVTDDEGEIIDQNIDIETLGYSGIFPKDIILINEYIANLYIEHREDVDLPYYVFYNIDKKVIPFSALAPLNDIDKNQALANLGIDPVVWKYMCNPFIINLPQSSGDIPTDLYDIIYDEDDLLKPIILKLMVIKTANDSIESLSQITERYTVTTASGLAISISDQYWEELA